MEENLLKKHVLTSNYMLFKKDVFSVTFVYHRFNGIFVYLMYGYGQEM